MTAELRVRSCFLLFQIVVTPLYAAVMLLAVLDPARADVPDRGDLVPDEPRGARADLRHPVARRRRSRTSRPIRAPPHIVMSQAQLDVGDARAQPVLPAARLRRQEGAPVDPVLRLGLRARLADHDRPQGRHRRDGADRDAGPRAVRAGLLDRRLSRRHAHPRRHAGEVQDGRRAPRHRDGRARSSRSRTTPATCGRRACSASVPARHDVDRRADLARGQGRRDAHRRKSKRGSRPRSRASACRHDATSAADRAPRMRFDGRSSADRRARRRQREGHARTHHARRPAGRLPAGPRAPAHDRHGGRPGRPHRARAALGDAVARSRRRCTSARTGSCGRSPSGARAGAT